MKVKIKDIQIGMRNIDIDGLLVKMEKPVEIMTKYGKAIIADATLRDESGLIRWRLWRWQVDKVKLGDVVRIRAAFVRMFKGEKQLNIGRGGSISIIGHVEESEL